MMPDLTKPTKAARKPLKVDMSNLALPKESPARDSDYKAYVRSHPCAIKGRNGHRCVLPVEAAHIKTAGFCIKSSDYATIPLCVKAHEWTQHQIGWPEFMIRYDLNPWHVAWKLLEHWHRMVTK